MNNKLRFLLICLLFFCCKKENESPVVDCRIDGRSYPMKYSAFLDKKNNVMNLTLTYIGSAPEYDIEVYLSNLPYQSGKTFLSRDTKGPTAYFEVINGDYPIDDYELLQSPDSSYFEVNGTVPDQTSVSADIRLKLVWFPLYGPKGGDFPDTLLFECPTSNFLF